MLRWCGADDDKKDESDYDGVELAEWRGVGVNVNDDYDGGAAMILIEKKCNVAIM